MNEREWGKGIYEEKPSQASFFKKQNKTQKPLRKSQNDTQQIQGDHMALKISLHIMQLVNKRIVKCCEETPQDKGEPYGE